MDEFGLTIMDIFTEKLQGYIDSNKLKYIRQEIISSVAPLEKYSVKELRDKCKEVEIACSGSKHTLISRLLKYNSNNSPKTSLDNSKFIQIEKNTFGNFEHKESCLVFDPVEKVVIGRQLPSGEVTPLTKKDINKCHQYKFGYLLPENLNETNEQCGDILDEDSDLSESDLVLDEEDDSGDDSE